MDLCYKFEFSCIDILVMQRNNESINWKIYKLKKRIYRNSAILKNELFLSKYRLRNSSKREALSGKNGLSPV
jgi:hypothetical protein